MFPQPESGHDRADHKAELADRGDDACVPLSHKTSQNTFGKVMMGRRGLRAIKCPGGFINQDNIRERRSQSSYVSPRRFKGRVSIRLISRKHFRLNLFSLNSGIYEYWWWSRIPNIGILSENNFLSKSKAYAVIQVINEGGF